MLQLMARFAEPQAFCICLAFVEHCSLSLPVPSSALSCSEHKTSLVLADIDHKHFNADFFGFSGVISFEGV